MPSDNISIIGKKNILIPSGFYDINPRELVKKDDKICFVAITNLNKKEYNITWQKPDDTEIGKIKRFSGMIVIRKN